MTPVPHKLVEMAHAGLIEALVQEPFDLRPEGWLNELPEHRAVFDDLPVELGRDSVRAFCDRQERDADGLLATFLASQVWGHRHNGFGPDRVANNLSDPDLSAALGSAAEELDGGDPVAAFKALCVDFKVYKLGMSFGTKFLFFADRQRRALILDEKVAEWIEANAAEKLKLGRNAATYSRWLHLAEEWAQVLDLTSEQVELAIFTDILNPGSPWNN